MNNEYHAQQGYKLLQARLDASKKKSKRSGNKVWVENPNVKGGGFWRKVGKAALYGAVGIAGLNVAGAAIGGAALAANHLSQKRFSEEDQSNYSTYMSHRGNEKEVEKLKNGSSDDRKFHDEYMRGKTLYEKHGPKD